MSFPSSSLFKAISPALSPAFGGAILDGHFVSGDSVYFARARNEPRSESCAQIPGAPSVRRADDGSEYEILCAKPDSKSSTLGAYLVEVIDQRDGYLSIDEAQAAAVSSLRRHQQAFTGCCDLAQ